MAAKIDFGLMHIYQMFETWQIEQRVIAYVLFIDELHQGLKLAKKGIFLPCFLRMQQLVFHENKCLHAGQGHILRGCTFLLIISDFLFL